MNIPTQRYAQDLRKYYRLPSVQVSLTLVLSLFVAAIFIVFALRPTLVSIVTLQKTINESKTTLQKLDTKVAALQKASAQLDTIKPLLAILNTDIPNNGAAYSPLTLAVESIANQNSARLENESLGPTLLFSRIIAPFAPNKSQNVVPLPFAVRVTGNYPSVAAFLTKLLTMERIVSIDTVSITKEATGKTTEATVTLNINGSAYYLADQAQLEKSINDLKGK